MPESNIAESYIPRTGTLTVALLAAGLLLSGYRDSSVSALSTTSGSEATSQLSTAVSPMEQYNDLPVAGCELLDNLQRLLSTPGNEDEAKHLPEAAAACEVQETGKVAVVYFGGVTEIFATQTAKLTEAMLHTMSKNKVTASLVPVAASPAAEAAFKHAIGSQKCVNTNDSTKWASIAAAETMPELESDVSVLAITDTPPCNSNVGGVTDSTKQRYADLFVVSKGNNTVTSVAIAGAHEEGHIYGLGHEGMVNCNFEDPNAFQQLGAPSPKPANIDKIRTCGYAEYGDYTEDMSQYSPEVMAGGYGAKANIAEVGTVNTAMFDLPAEIINHKPPDENLLTSQVPYVFTKETAKQNQFVSVLLDKPIELHDAEAAKVKSSDIPTKFTKLVIRPWSSVGSEEGVSKIYPEIVFEASIELANDDNVSTYVGSIIKTRDVRLPAAERPLRQTQILQIGVQQVQLVFAENGSLSIQLLTPPSSTK